MIEKNVGLQRNVKFLSETGKNISVSGTEENLQKHVFAQTIQNVFF